MRNCIWFTVYIYTFSHFFLFLLKTFFKVLVFYFNCPSFMVFVSTKKYIIGLVEYYRLIDMFSLSFLLKYMRIEFCLIYF